MGGGRFIQGINKALWVERYREPGEFSFEAPMDQNLHGQAPVGSFVSHTDSNEIMVVENCEVQESNDRPEVVVISGRSLDAFLDYRVVGSELVSPPAGPITEYTLAADTVWEQAGQLIKDHILAANVTEPKNALPNTMVDWDAPDIGSPPYDAGSVSRTIDRGSLHKRLIEHLETFDLGIRIQRPRGGYTNPTLVKFVIHGGTQRSSPLVSFSQTRGGVTDVQYFDTNKTYYNALYLGGEYIDRKTSAGTHSGYARRVKYYDLTQDQSHLVAPLAPATQTLWQNFMQWVSDEVLPSYRATSLMDVTISNRGGAPVYGKDYEIGDIVRLDGRHGVKWVRAVEHIIAKDRDGVTKFPGFSDVDPGWIA